MQTIVNYIKHPSRVALGFVKKTRELYSDSLYLRLYYFFNMGKVLHLKNPITFSEKLQWLKLFDRNPLYTTLVDKYAVKKYVADRIGAEHVIPTLAVWSTADEIDFSALPNQFVLKTTHSGGGCAVVVCKDKASLDPVAVREKMAGSMKADIWKSLKEFQYKDVPKRIIAEEYIAPSEGKDDLPDYKFFCFNGEPKYCQVISGRGKKMSIDFFDRDWVHQPFHEPKIFPFADVTPEKPHCLGEMWNAARELSQGKPFSRIDFYESNGSFYFGEITFYPTSGMGGFEPEIWDYKFGEMINLPESKA